MKKFFSLLLVVAMLVPAVAALAQESVSFLLTYPQEKKELYQILEDFETETGITVDVLYMPLADAKTQINIMVASNTLADVLDVDGIDTRAYAAMGILKDLTDKVSGELDAFYEGPMEFAEYEGRYYGLPLSPSNLSLYYNADMLAAAGIDKVPETWEELEEALALLSNDDVYGIALPANSSSDAAFAFLCFYFQAGGTIETLGDEATVVALDFYKKLLDNKWMSIDMVNWGLEDGANQFLGGKAAFLIDGCWRIKSMTANCTFNWGTAPLPAGPVSRATALGGHNIAASNGDNFENAWKLISYITNAENMKRFCESENYLPARVDVAEASEYFKSGPIKAFADSLAFTKPRGPLVQWPSYEDIMVQMVQSVVIGERTPEEAAAWAKEEVAKYLD